MPKIALQADSPFFPALVLHQCQWMCQPTLLSKYLNERNPKVSQTNWPTDGLIGVDARNTALTCLKIWVQLGPWSLINAALIKYFLVITQGHRDNSITILCYNQLQSSNCTVFSRIFQFRSYFVQRCNVLEPNMEMEAGINQMLDLRYECLYVSKLLKTITWK